MSESDSIRCPLHPKHPQKDCLECRHQDELSRALEEARARSASNQKTTALPTVAVPTPDEIERVRRALGITPEPPPPPITVSRRHFYRPLPAGKLPEWPNDISINYAAHGLTPENIAAFLTMPQMLYTDYEKNKDSPPAPTLLPASKSFYTGYRNSFAAHERKTIGTTWVDVGDVLVIPERAFSAAGLAPQKRRRKIPQIQLQDQLREAKERRRSLSMKNQKKLPNGIVDSRALKVQQRKADRRVESLEEKLRKIVWREEDVPETGLAPFSISIPPCPTGSKMVFPWRVVTTYFYDVWSGLYEEENWPDFENFVIERAAALSIFCRIPRTDRVNAQQFLGVFALAGSTRLDPKGPNPIKPFQRRLAPDESEEWSLINQGLKIVWSNGQPAPVRESDIRRIRRKGRGK